MRVFVPILASLVALTASPAASFSLSMQAARSTSSSSRRAFLGTAGASVAAIATAGSVQGVPSALAAPQIFKTNGGIKYAVTKDDAKGGYPQQGDIVAIEYTGYLTTGTIFDGTHSEGKQNALLFKLGSTAVIPGINEMVSEMKVGQKVQAIIPPELAFGEKGICIESGECLVKPGSTLVYDIYLKKSSIPPP
jgi:FKBP-type peptidyl-prolyl cis-trans isomerase